MEFPDTITIEITQQDIDEGKRSNCTKCPGALAAARYFGNVSNVDMTHTRLYVDDPDSPVTDERGGWRETFAVYKNPPNLIEFIYAYDNKGGTTVGHVEPITATLTRKGEEEL